MAGVIDGNGVQWERCNACAKWVTTDNLGYVKPSPTHPHGQDLCVSCVDKGLRQRLFRFSAVVPAPKWRRVLTAR